MTHDIVSLFEREIEEMKSSYVSCLLARVETPKHAGFHLHTKGFVLTRLAVCFFKFNRLSFSSFLGKPSSIPTSFQSDIFFLPTKANGENYFSLGNSILVETAVM